MSVKYMLNLSNVALKIPSSPIRKLVPFANVAKKNNIKIYHLNIGDPDIETPQVMIKAINNWSRNPIAYSDSQGQKELLDSLCFYYNHLGFKISQDHLQVTFGGSEGIFWAMLTIANPGDEILVFEPFYANYNSFAIMCHVNLIPIKTSIKNGFHLPDRHEIEKKITSKTKGILICNPGNPTGTVYTQQELDMLLKIAKKYKIFLLADEVYREFTYDGKRATSLLSYTKEYPEGIIVLDSLSKRYSLCGARLGVMVSYNQKVMQTVLKYAQARLSTGLIDQLMASKLNEVAAEYFNKVNIEYQNRRNTLYQHLSQIKGVYCQKPEGAFYMIVELPVENAEDFAKWLLTDFQDNSESVMVAPAAGFYKTPGEGTREVRMAYVINQKNLVRATELLRLALEKYNSRS